MKWTDLLLSGVLNIVAPSLFAQDSSGKAVQQKTVHLVSTAHFDTQWKWTVQASINNYLFNTLQDNFALLEKYPDYVFNFEGAIRYMWIKEYYPYQYGKLKAYIAKGRWNIAGSSLDAGDVNMPSPEALIRNFLLGQQFYKKEFGKTSSDVYLPDCFGFPYSLPSIAAHCGLKSFTTIKLRGNSAVGLPFELGTWEGPDGSAILAAINPGSVNARIRSDASQDTAFLRSINTVGEKTGVYIAYKLYGTGDRGGSPDDLSVSWLEKSLRGNGPIKVIAASTDLLGRQLTPAQLAKFPRYKGEFILSKHGTGTYTSQGFMKWLNRKNEQLADATERLSIAADWLGSAKYPKAKLNEAWTRFIWHQFHDDLTGTSIPEVYAYSWNDELVSQNQFSAVLNHAAGAVAAALDTRGTGTPLSIYNPLSVEREAVVEAIVMLPFSGKAVRVYNKDGKEVPAQMKASDGTSYHILFLAKLPANGFSVYDVRQTDEPAPQKSVLKVSTTSLENARYKVAIDQNGDIASVLDKQYKKELLQAPMRLELLNNPSVDWPQWEILYSSVTQNPRNYVSGIKSINVEEDGPVRIAVKIVRETEGSTFTQYIRLSNGETGDRVDVVNDVDWRTTNTLLKASFPFTVSNPTATYDLGLGTVERQTNTEKMYEVPAQQWADLSSPEGTYGITVMNDCKYGWDKPSDNTLRLTLFHTPKPAVRYPIAAFQDFGKHHFTYSIAGHKGGWKNESTVWQPAFLNQPVLSFQTGKHNGPLGKSFSLAALNTRQVAIKAIKQAENSDEIIIRVQELTGAMAKNVLLSMPATIIAAREVNGVEDSLGTAVIQSGKLLFTMHPYQPRSFALTISKPSAVVENVQCLPLVLKFNAAVTSPDVDRTAGNLGDFDRKGHTIPSELWPESIQSEGVLFQLGPKTLGPNSPAYNAIVCRQDTITLPQGKYNRVYILAAATEDTHGDFIVDGKTTDIGVQYYSGFIGQGQSLVFHDKLKPVDPTFSGAYLKTDNIAWVGTHRHDFSGINEAYTYCYLYKYAIDINEGAKTLILPDNDKIRVMAITMTNDKNAATRAVGQ